MTQLSELPTVSRAQFGDHIDQINRTIREQIWNELTSVLTEYENQPLTEKQAIEIQSTVDLKVVEEIYLESTNTLSLFMTTYSGTDEFFNVDNIIIDDLLAVEMIDRIKIVWNCKPFDQRNNPRCIKYRTIDVKSNVTVVYYPVGMSFLVAKLIARSVNGFVIFEPDQYDNIPIGIDFFTFEEAAQAEQQASPDQPIDYYTHSAYRALKMLIS